MRNLAYISFSSVFALVAYTAIRHDSADRTVNIPPAQSEDEAVQEIAFSSVPDYPQANLKPETQQRRPRLSNTASQQPQSVVQRSQAVISVPLPPAGSIREQMLANSQGNSETTSPVIESAGPSASTPLPPPPSQRVAAAIPTIVSNTIPSSPSSSSAPTNLALNVSPIAELPSPSLSADAQPDLSADIAAASLTDIASSVPEPWGESIGNNAIVEPMTTPSVQLSGESPNTVDGHWNENPDRTLPRFSGSSSPSTSIQSQVAPSSASN